MNSASYQKNIFQIFIKWRGITHEVWFKNTSLLGKKFEVSSIFLIKNWLYSKIQNQSLMMYYSKVVISIWITKNEIFMFSYLIGSQNFKKISY